MPGHSVLFAHRCAGHPRLGHVATPKTWMAGTSPAMTKSQPWRVTATR